MESNVLSLVSEQAAAVGLQPKAVLRATSLPEEALERLDGWISKGHAGAMDYLERGRPQMADLRHWKPWVRSAVLFAVPYSRSPGGFRGGGRVARYALGRDYHNILGKKLERLGRRLRESCAIEQFRAVVDAAPVLEREWALLGQLGFRGKNTLVLDPRVGPWTLLGELLVDAEWPEWLPPAPAASCGSCTRCLDDCPTDAFPTPYQLDARRCISYLTIELRGPIPVALRPAVGEWVFGCDVCLEACPFGHRAPATGEPWGRLAALDELSLEDLLALDRTAFANALAGSPLRRPGWAGLLRNACVVLGNLGRGAEALKTALSHEEPLVRGHAAWALGRLGERHALESARARESKAWVLEELALALESLS